MRDIDLLGYALMGDDDLDGDDLDGDDLGAFGDYATDIAEGLTPFQMYQMRKQRRRKTGTARANALIKKFSPAAGVQKHGLRDLYLPFPLFTFTATSGTTLTQLTRPQRPFAPRRPVLEIIRTGVTATALPVVALLQIGDRPQSIGEAGGVVGSGAFAPNAFQTSLNLDRADPGVSIGLTINLVGGAALAMADTIIVAATLIGHSLS